MRPRGGDGFLDDDQRTASAAFAQDSGEFRVFRGEGIPCENNTVLEGDGNLEIVAGHQRGR